MRPVLKRFNEERIGDAQNNVWSDKKTYTGQHTWSTDTFNTHSRCRVPSGGGCSGETYGACVRVVYSLNSLSWMVKYGRKSQQYFRGLMELRDRLCHHDNINTGSGLAGGATLKISYLMRASTVSEDMVGDGAMMTTGSPSNVSSHSICRWTRTDWKHLRTQVRLQMTWIRTGKLDKRRMYH